MPYRCVAGGCSRTSDDGTSSPQTRHSPANCLKRYAYIARIGEGRPPPPPNFAACISPATATTGKQL